MGLLHFGERPFTGHRRSVQVHLDGDERAVLVQLLSQLDDLLDDGRVPATDPLAELLGLSDLSGSEASATPTAPPADPAVARLLPEANRDDPQLATEFRRLTETGLRARKRSGARDAAASLQRPDPVQLTTEEAWTLLKAITDLRLVLGERLELRSDPDAELLHRRLLSGDAPDGWLATASIYEVLTGWQESLVAAMSRRRS
jgi:hypothetical protein